MTPEQPFLINFGESASCLIADGFLLQESYLCTSGNSAKASLSVAPATTL